MPTPAIYPDVIAMSPSGKQLAVASKGIEIYNFNGASPLTLASSMPISARDFGWLAWDNNSHLYAVDYETGDLYVYTVGGSSIAATSGTPYTIPDNTNGYNQYDLIVVPK
jgi:phage baseplate assembly protein gpV